MGSLSLRPGDLLTIPKMALSVGFIRFVSSTDATQAKGLLTFTPVGLPPTEHVCLSWTHSQNENHTHEQPRDCRQNAPGRIRHELSPCGNCSPTWPISSEAL
jgi:hypothetical protein